MAKILEKLTPLTVARQKTKGMYHDGGGLYLRVKADGGKSWAFRYTLHGKAREMGLGGFPTVSLADARNAANECRRMLTTGQDPIKNRSEKHAQAPLADAKNRTFRQCAEDYIDAHKSGWRNPKHIQQWGNTLRDYAYPFIGDIGVADIDVSLVSSVLEQKNKAFGKGETL